MAKDFYSTREISKELLDDILESITNVKGWGTVEIFIQDHKVTQLTEKSIIKTDALAGSQRINA